MQHTIHTSCSSAASMSHPVSRTFAATGVRERATSRRLRVALAPMAVLAMFAASGAQAADHFVRAGASGTGTDWSNAYGSLPATLVRGDTYYVAAGSYPGRTFGTAASGTTPITIKKATVSDHGTATGWNDAYGTGQAAFTGGWVFTSPYWVLDGQTGGGAANAWAGNFGFKVTETGDGSAVINIGQAGSADNVTIRHVDLQGEGHASTAGGSYSNDGLAVYGSANVTLSYFRMAGIGRCPFFVSPSNLVVEHGWVQSYFGSTAVHSEVASIWAFSGNVGDVTFRNNLFTDIQSTGGLMWDNSSNPSAKLAVYGNVFYKPPGANWQQANGLVGGWTGGHGEQYGNATVVSNTFINVDQESLSSFPNVYSNNVAYDNLFINSQAPNFSKYAAHDANMFVASGGNPGEPLGAVASSLSLANVAGLDFRLVAATPAGKVMAAPFNADPLGIARGADGTYDRGAFEFGGSAALPPAPVGLTVK